MDQVDKYGPFFYMGYLNKEGKAQFKEPRFKSPKSTIEQSKDEKWS